MKKYFNKLGGIFGTAIILLVLTLLSALVANWVDVFRWIALGFACLTMLLVVLMILYVWIIRPIIELFKGE